MEDKMKSPREELDELANSITCRLFADRPSIAEAADYVYSFRSTEVTTATHVMLNTLANEIKRILGII